ncbi:MAG: branched-chain amino acid transport system ATP-binding protein [Actinomycetota bacterium]|jgi:branched-chain amino acid transport system ATP-binding protein|nr:branched-chain amino acid transport system ATP-binding protein [Actinomycetota bacterium]
MSGSLQACGLTTRFAGVVALHDVDIQVHPGEIVGLIGPNGAGKTTCFNSLTGFVTPNEGRVVLGGEDVTDLPPAERARRGMVRTFQQVVLFKHLSVRENLLLGRHIHYGANGLQGVLRTGRARAAERVAEEHVEAVAARCGLTPLLDAPAGDLPYGTQRMVEVARALSAEPSVLLLDEPAAGMDPTESDYFGDLLLQIHDGHHSVVLIEHDVPMVLRVCDRIYVLQFGQLIAQGSPDEIRANAAVREAYFGSAVEVAS